MTIAFPTSVVALLVLAGAISAQEVRTCNYNNRSFASNPAVPIRGRTHTCFCINGIWERCTVNSGVPEPQQSQSPNIRPLTARARRLQFDGPDFVFDLRNQPKVSSGIGGEIRTANMVNFPALQGQGLSLTLFSLEPCGINLPHVHPRATEIIFLIRGNNLKVAIAEENGGRTLVNTIHEGQVTFFPQGLIHYQQNMGCEPAEYLSGLNSEDPGVLTISNRIFTFPTGALEATFKLPAHQIEILRKGIPAGPAQGRMECLRKCGLL